MRKYRLHGLAAGLVLLAGLSSGKMPRVSPPRARRKKGRICQRKGLGVGLCQSAPPQHRAARFAGNVFRRVEKIRRPGRKNFNNQASAGGRIFRVENSLPNRDRNPIAAYKSISNTLGTRNKKL